MMGAASGLASQMMVIAESVYGTRVVPTRGFEFNSESMKFHVDPIVSKGARAGRLLPYRRTTGKQWVDGDVTIDLGPIGSGLLLKHGIGKDVTSGAGPYTHVYTPGFELDALSMTWQLCKPFFDGTLQPHDYLGVQIVSWEINQDISANLTYKMSTQGLLEQLNQTTATASYPATAAPHTWDECVLTIGGTVMGFQKLSITGDNAMALGLHRGSASAVGKGPKQARRMGQAAYGGTLALDYENTTNYAKYLARTDTSFSAVWTKGANILTVAGNVHFEGDTPDVSDTEKLVDLGLPFVFTGTPAGSDAAAFTVTLVNTDTLS